MSVCLSPRCERSILRSMTTPPADTGTTRTIRATADAVLSRYPDSLDRATLLTRICRDEGIELLEADLRDIAGVLRHEDAGWRIYLSRQDSPQRRQYTLAHLLGHFFLHAEPGRSFVEGPLTAGR